MDYDNIKEDSKRKKNTRKIHYNIDEDKHASPKKSSLKSQNIDVEKKSPKKSEKIKNLKKQINEEELPSIGGKKYKSTKRQTYLLHSNSLVINNSILNLYTFF